RHIEERKARGLFAEMRFTMAQPEVSCHPEALLPGARMVVSAAHCYYAPEPPLEPGEGRLARYTWHDGYAVLREPLREPGRRMCGAEGAARWGGAWAASTASSSTRISTSTGRRRHGPVSASTARTR